MQEKWDIIAHEIEKTLRQKSLAELNRMVAEFSGLPIENFHKVPTKVLEQTKLYMWLCYSNQNSWLQPIWMEWTCRFASPERFQVSDPKLSTAMILAYLKYCLLLQYNETQEDNFENVLTGNI